MDKELINILMAISGAFAVSEHENKALKAEIERLKYHTNEPIKAHQATWVKPAYNELTVEIESLNSESAEVIKQLQESLREAKRSEESTLNRLNAEYAINESSSKRLKELEDATSSLRKERSALVETLEDTKVTLANEHIKVDKLKQSNSGLKKEVAILQNKHFPVFNLADILKEKPVGTCIATMFFQESDYTLRVRYDKTENLEQDVHLYVELKQRGII